MNYFRRESDFSLWELLTVVGIVVILFTFFMLGLAQEQRCAAQRGEWRYTRWPIGICFTKGAVLK